MTLYLSEKIDAINSRHFFVASAQNKTDFKCSQCLKEIEEGFVCENNRNLVLCNKCQEDFQMQHCRHNKIGEHKHIKWIKE